MSQWMKRRLSFDDTAALESRLGVSLIENSVNDAWKSTDSGAYDWKTGTYTPYDGKTWVNASKAVVMHYLDPRNQLSEENVFQFLELSYNPSYHTIDTVQAMLNGTFMQCLTVACRRSACSLLISSRDKVSYCGCR